MHRKRVGSVVSGTEACDDGRVAIYARGLCRSAEEACHQTHSELPRMQPLSITQTSTFSTSRIAVQISVPIVD